MAQTQKQILTPNQHQRSHKAAHTIAPDLGLKPIFIHSSFRTSSTWLWLSFRRSPSTIAFYEAFHEILACINLENIESHDSSSWNSYHPHVKAYFDEYSPLVRPAGGVQNYLDGMAFSQFVPTEGLSSTLAASEQLYISKLIESTITLGQTPVLTFCRSLGRAAAIKKTFGGWHIFLHRNLFRQWMSYLQQYTQKNDYFIYSTFSIIKFNTHDPYISWLAKQHNISINNADDTTVGGFSSLDVAFYAFVGLHLYLSVHAFTELDQPIDADQLSRDPGYRHQMEEIIATRGGVKVDLSDARSSFRFADGQWHPPQGAEKVIDRLWRQAVKQLHVPPESQAHNFGTRLVCELLDQLELYRNIIHHARARADDDTRDLSHRNQKLVCELQKLQSGMDEVRAQLDQANKKVRDAAEMRQGLERELQKLRTSMVDTRTEVAHLKDKALDARRLNQKLQHETQNLRSSLGSTREDLLKLESSLRAIEQSISWRITKPLRGALALLNRLTR